LAIIFDTHSNQDKASIPIAKDPHLTADENNFVENTYGVTELRDGFFDAAFLPPEHVDYQDLMRHAEETLPFAFRKKRTLYR
jgi:hypothetical protein